MENQANTAASNQLGICEKLFNTFWPALCSLQRLTAAPAKASSAHSEALPEPTPPSLASAPPVKKVQWSTNQEKPKAEPMQAQETAARPPAPPNTEVRPKSGKKLAKGKQLKAMNNKVEDYIKITKSKIRSGSGVGRTPSSK